MVEDEVKSFKEKVNGALERIVSGQPGRGYVLAESSMHPDLVEISKYSISSEGNMWRPLFLRSTAVGRYGVSEKLVIPYAAVLEGNHINTLNLDDLPCMDDQDTRRGKPTPHIQFSLLKKTSKDSGTSKVIISVFSLLDYFNKAVDYGPAAREQNSKISDEFSAARINLGHGQYLDLNKTREFRDLEGFVNLYRLKTGPLFGIALAIGGILGNETEENVNLLREAGYNFGIVYQFIDDFLDWGGIIEKVGKPLGFDPRKNNFLNVSMPEQAYRRLLQHKGLTIKLLSDVGGDFSEVIRLVDEIERKFVDCMKPEKLAELKNIDNSGN